MARENKKGFAVALVGLLGAVAAHAEVAYEVEAGVGASDNITRVATDEIDETLASLGLTLDWQEQSRRINGTTLIDLSYVEYLDDTYDSEVLGTASADITFGIVPERFTWLVSDEFGQSQTDPFAPVTPETRENINYFTTGPDFILRFGQAMVARVFGRYSITDYEDSPLDADRVTFGMAIGRDFSARSRAALNLVSDSSSFDDAVNTDYERRSAYLSYDLTGTGRTTINSRLGYSWLELDGADETGGPLFGLDLTRQLTEASQLTLSAVHEFSDAGEMLGDAGQGSTEITSSSDPFESSEISLGWRFDKHRTSFGLTTSYSQRRYETQASIDSDRTNFSLDLGRRLRPTLRLGLVASLTNEEFVNTAVDSDEWLAGLTLDWQFGRHMGLRLRVDHNERSATEGAGDYEENRAFLSFTFIGNRAPSGT
jgi:hypothetical protein